MHNYNNDIYPLSTQNRRIFCAYHTTQFLTNFCQQKQCLMPLCPSCIAEHTQQHFQQGKKPTYTNINQAINKAKQSCYCTIVTMQQYKKLNQNIFQYVSTLQANIHLQLQQKRNQIFDIITSIFIEFQARLIKQINDNYIDKNVYSMDQSLNASKYIDEQISNLYQKISFLKGQECLSALITYYAVDQQNYRQALQQFDQYFEKNRKAGKIQISIIQEELNKITNNFCDNLLSIESIVQNFQPKIEEPVQNDSLRSKRYGFSRVMEKQVQKTKRRSIFQKQNQQNNKKQSPRKFQKPENLILIRNNQDRQKHQDISFNAQNQKNRNNEGGFTRSINEQSKHNSRRSGDDNPIPTNYESKRLTRDFKRQY